MIADQRNPTDLIELAGGRNPLAELDVKSKPLSDEEVAALDADAFVISWCGVKPHKYRKDVVLRRPALQGSRALRHGSVFCVPEAFVGRPGPRLVDGYRALCEIVAACRARSADA